MVAAKRVVIHAHASDVEASHVFYGKLGFARDTDEVDGTGARYVRMTHHGAPGLQLSLQNAPHLLRSSEVDPRLSPEQWPVLFSLQVESCVDWGEHLQREGVELISRYGQPWAGWLHVRDPAGNLICITTSDLL